jgi:Arm DNA-binding domain
MAKLTKRSVDALHPRAKHYLVFDDEIHGFSVRVHASSQKTFFVRCRFGGADRKLNLGHYGSITVEQARGLALKARAAIADGVDPSAAQRKLAASGSIKGLVERFLREHVQIHCKPSTQREYRRSLEFFINPKPGNRQVGSIAREDIAELHHSLAHIPYQANRTLGVLSKMLNLVEIWGLRPDGSNPCRHVKSTARKSAGAI